MIRIKSLFSPPEMTYDSESDKFNLLPSFLAIQMGFDV